METLRTFGNLFRRFSRSLRASSGEGRPSHPVTDPHTPAEAPPSGGGRDERGDRPGEAPALHKKVPWITDPVGPKEQPPREEKS